MRRGEKRGREARGRWRKGEGGKIEKREEGTGRGRERKVEKEGGKGKGDGRKRGEVGGGREERGTERKREE